MLQSTGFAATSVAALASTNFRAPEVLQDASYLDGQGPFQQSVTPSLGAGPVDVRALPSSHKFQQQPLGSSFAGGDPNLQFVSQSQSFQPLPGRPLAGRTSLHLPIRNWNQMQQLPTKQYQQGVDKDVLMNQLEAQLQLNQAMHAATSPSQQDPIALLLAQQREAQKYHEPPGNYQEGYFGPNLPHGWPGHAVAPSRPPVAPFAGQPAFNRPELTGKVYSFVTPHDQRFLGQAAARTRGRSADHEDSVIEKSRKELSRLQLELERMEKEVVRQKGLRDMERMEFLDAKDRLKHSWAADRDDFARVKGLLKTKNAEHHAQSGRLSQQLKEVEAVNRGLRELCIRNGLLVPQELELGHFKLYNSQIAVESRSGVVSGEGDTRSHIAAERSGSQAELLASSKTSSQPNISFVEAWGLQPAIPPGLSSLQAKSLAPTGGDAAIDPAVGGAAKLPVGFAEVVTVAGETISEEAEEDRVTTAESQGSRSVVRKQVEETS